MRVYAQNDTPKKRPKQFGAYFSALIIVDFFDKNVKFLNEIICFMDKKLPGKHGGRGQRMMFKIF